MRHVYRLRRGARSALAAALSMLVASGSGWAAHPNLLPQVLSDAGTPKLTWLVVGLDSQSQAVAGSLSYYAEQAVVRSGRFTAVRLSDALDPTGLRARLAKIDEGESAMKAGQKAFDELDTQKAANQFERAFKAYEQTDLTRHLKELSGAWVMRIASLVANGENKAAQLEMERVLVVDPRAIFSPNYFTPEAISHAERVRRTSVSGPLKIEVRTSPPGAQIYMDGHFVGVSPTTASGLAAGDHYVTALRPGSVLTQQRVRSGPVDLTLAKADGAARLQAVQNRIDGDPDGPDRDRAAQELGKALGVDQLLLVLARKSPAGQQVDVTALRLDVKDGHNYAYQMATLPLGDGLAAAADGVFSSIATLDEPRRGGPVTHFSTGGGTRTAGLAIGGAGAALLVTGLVFGGVAISKNNQFRHMAQTDPSAPRVARSGKTFAVLADVGVLAGLVAGGVGAYLAFFSRRSAEPARAAELPMPPPPRVKPAEKPVEAPPPPPPPAAEPEKPAPKNDTVEEPAHGSRKKREEERRREEQQRQEEQRREAEQLRDAERKRRQEEQQQKANNPQPPPPPPPATPEKKPDEDDLRNY